MVVALITTSLYAEKSWPFFFAAFSVLAGIIPHAALLLRPPLGQLPGLSIVINYALCFAHRYVLITAALLTYAAVVYGFATWNSATGFVALEGLLIHALNWYRYQAIARTAAENVAGVIEAATPEGATKLIACDDDHDELGRLQRTWVSLFTYGPVVVTLARLFQNHHIKLHRNIKYMDRGEFGPKNAPACYLDVEYSTDPATFSHFEQRPIAIYMHGGAWCFGHPYINTGSITRWLLACRGYIVVSIGYRFAPRQPWPAQLRCLVQALRWVRRSYGRHPALPTGQKVSAAGTTGTDGVPTAPMFLVGASAGAHVSVTFSLIQALIRSGAAADHVHPDLQQPVRDALKDDVTPVGVIAFYPPTDMQDKLGSYLKFPFSLPAFFGASAGPVRQQSMFAWFFQRVVSQRRSASSSPAAATEEDAFLKSSCPLELLSILQAHVSSSPSPKPVDTLMPVFVIHCGGDSVVPVASSKEFMKHLAEYRANCDRSSSTPEAQGCCFDVFLDVPTVGHSFDIFLTHLTANASRAVFAWATSMLPPRERRERRDQGSARARFAS